MQNSVLVPLTLIEIWALFAVFLFFKLVSDTIIQGKVKLDEQAFMYPEDQKMMGKGPAKPLLNEQNISNTMRRAVGLWRNDLENLIPFSILSLAAALIQACSSTTYSVILSLFALSRVAHAYFMMKGRQPHRNLSYQVGNVAALSLIIVILWHLWQR